MPVGLWNYSYAKPCRLKGATDDGSTERRVINVGIGREEYDIHLVPAS